MLDSIIFLIIGVMGVGGNAYYDYQAMQKRLEPYREQLYKIHGSCDRPKLELFHDAILAAKNVDELNAFHDDKQMHFLYGKRYTYYGTIIDISQIWMDYKEIFEAILHSRFNGCNSKEKIEIAQSMRDIKEHLNKIAPQELLHCPEETRSPAWTMMHHIDNFFRENNCKIDKAAKKYAAIKEFLPELSAQKTEVKLATLCNEFLNENIEKEAEVWRKKIIKYVSARPHKFGKLSELLRERRPFSSLRSKMNFKKSYKEDLEKRKEWIRMFPDIEARCIRDDVNFPKNYEAQINKEICNPWIRLERDLKQDKNEYDNFESTFREIKLVWEKRHQILSDIRGEWKKHVPDIDNHINNHKCHYLCDYPCNRDYQCDHCRKLRASRKDAKACDRWIRLNKTLKEEREEYEFILTSEKQEKENAQD